MRSVADLVADEMHGVLRTAGSTALPPSGQASPPSPAQAVGGPMDADLPFRLMAALGGRDNVAAVDIASTRILVTLHEAGMIDLPALETLGLRGIARPAPNSLHLIVGPNAPAILAGLRSLIGA